jgi:hypothetical protein
MKLEDRLRSANQEKWIDSIFDLMIRYENIYNRMIIIRYLNIFSKKIINVDIKKINILVTSNNKEKIILARAILENEKLKNE